MTWKSTKILSLSYSTWSAYLKCPAMYKIVTLPKEEREKLPPPTERDRYNMAFGNIMHDLVNTFYDKRLFMNCSTLEKIKDTYTKLKQLASYVTERHLEGITLGVKFKPLTLEDFKERVYKATKVFLANCIKHRLFGIYTGSEVKLNLKLLDYNVILLGTTDLVTITKKPEQSCRIIDFKSRRNDTVEVDQLLWYALMWYYKWGYYPNEIGFYYFEGEPNFEIIPFTPEMLQKLMASILMVRDKIYADNKFRAIRNEKCWSCRIKNTCSESPYYKDLESRNNAKQILDDSKTDTVGFGIPSNIPSTEGNTNDILAEF